MRRLASSRQLLKRAAVLGLREELVVVPSQVFCLVHRRVSVLKQYLRILSIDTERA